MCRLAGGQGQFPTTQNVTVVEGGTANMTCRVEYNDNTSLQWSNPAQQTLFFGDKKGESTQTSHVLRKDGVRKGRGGRLGIEERGRQGWVDGVREGRGGWEGIEERGREGRMEGGLDTWREKEREGWTERVEGMDEPSSTSR